MSWLDRHFPNRARPGEPLFYLAVAIVASGVIQVALGLALILHG